MKYKCPDGTILESQPSQTVTHTCPTTMDEGVYESFETKGSRNEIGIKQIRIKRTVEEGTMFIELTESTEEELQTYILETQQAVNPPVVEE